MIPYGKQKIDESDIDAVVQVLRSNYLTQGPAVGNFEDACSSYLGSKHAVAVANGTAALHLACLSLGLSKGDVLWTSPISFVASANCGKFCGAEIDFVDIDQDTWNLSIPRLEEKLELAHKQGCLPKILVTVHLCGLPCEMESISRLARQYGFRVIEDACHAIGASYLDSKIGDCKFSDVAVFSFHPVKNITSGEGGLVTTNSDEVYEQLKLLRVNGITREQDKFEFSPDGLWYYEQKSLGFNYRLTDIHAALGLSQLSKLDDFLNSRIELVKRYRELLADLPVLFQANPSHSVSGSHLFVVRLIADELPVTQRHVFEYLVANGIGANLHYIPIYRHPYYRSFGYSPESFPEAENYYSQAITLPLFPELTTNQQDEVVGQLKKALG